MPTRTTLAMRTTLATWMTSAHVAVSSHVMPGLKLSYVASCCREYALELAISPARAHVRVNEMWAGRYRQWLASVDYGLQAQVAGIQGYSVALCTSCAANTWNHHA